MKEKIYRNYLEIKSLSQLKEVKKPSENYFIEIADQKDFQLNKFFYKNIGKNCQWVDRLVWTDLNWIEYVSNKNFSTYVLKEKNEVVGYYESLFNENNKEAEIVYFGILEEFSEKN